MRVDIFRIQNQLKDYHPKCFIGNHKTREIDKVKFYDGRPQKSGDNVLYIARASYFPELIQDKTVSNVLIIGDCILSENLVETAGMNLLLIKKDSDLSKIFKLIYDILAEKRKFTEKSEKLLDLLYEGKGLQNIIYKASQILDNPISLDDIGFRQITWGPGDNIDYQKVARVVDMFNSNYTFFYEHYRNDRAFEKVHKSRVPVYFAEEANLPAFIVSNIYMDDQIIAYISVLEMSKRFSESDYDLIYLLCNIVSHEMQKSNYYYYSRGTPFESVIHDLLNGKKSITLDFDERVKALNKDLKELKSVFIVEIPKDELDNTMIVYLRDRFQEMISDSRTVIHNNYIVIIYTFDKDHIINLRKMEALNEFLSKNHLYGGISRSFSNIRDLQDYYLQALMAIELGLRMDAGKTIYSYEDYVHYHIMSLCSRQADVKAFCHQSLIELISYDRKNNTRYTQFLYTYLKNSKNQLDTASKLNINRGTVAYRLSKVKEIMDVDLDNEELVFHLYLSFKILEYLGETDFMGTSEIEKARQ
ncbi:MAG: helix-turn-helix domain-containing protein [Clostridiales bacterium]|jgi:hypothetical protein|nr:helix-turn-helix domain-containing protein [Eubacteriales bacterium]MDH7566974.1 helix-turn-helix domain-containing protein [Clostridiales bacterium]